MEFYRLTIRFRIGSGTILVNALSPELFYQQGSSLVISTNLDPGYTGAKWFIDTIEISSSLFITYTMPARDVTIDIEAIGVFTPFSKYGLKYSNSFG